MAAYFFVFDNELKTNVNWHSKVNHRETTSGQWFCSFVLFYFYKNTTNWIIIQTNPMKQTNTTTIKWLQSDGAKTRGVGRALISRPSSIGLMRRQPHRVADEFGYTWMQAVAQTKTVVPLPLTSKVAALVFMVVLRKSCLMEMGGDGREGVFLPNVYAPFSTNSYLSIHLYD